LNQKLEVNTLAAVNFQVFRLEIETRTLSRRTCRLWFEDFDGAEART
jgi:hypothetical protein